MEIKLLIGDICVPFVLGGGVSTPNNPPYLRHCILHKLMVFSDFADFLFNCWIFKNFENRKLSYAKFEARHKFGFFWRLGRPLRWGGEDFRYFLIWSISIFLFSEVHLSSHILTPCRLYWEMIMVLSWCL